MESLQVYKTEGEIKSLSKIMRLLGHPLRLKSVFLLAENAELSAGDLCRMLKSEQTLVSHHLGDLRNSGILGTRRAGKSIIYFLVKKNLPEAIQTFVNQAGFEDAVRKTPQ